jgi:hypothetical protein
MRAISVCVPMNPCIKPEAKVVLHFADTSKSPEGAKSLQSLRAMLVIRNQCKLENPLLHGDQVRSIIRLTLY